MALYRKPRTLDEALDALAEARWTVLAGGTDFFPARAGHPVLDDVLDIGGLPKLAGVAETEAHWRIGSGTTWAALGRAAALPPAFDALKAAAREVGSVQIQNRATIGGNLCNASPAADGVPALMVLDAEVELRSVRGLRRLPLDRFILGNRHTARAPDELLTAVLVPKGSARGRSAFVKLGARRYLVISIAMAAARLDVEGGAVRGAAVAVGACSAVARRLSALEQALESCPLGSDALAKRVATEHMDPLSPIDDVRASALYRREAAAAIMRRALRQAAGDAPSEAAAA